MKILSKMESTNHEGTRLVICNYFGKAAASTKNEKMVGAYLRILDNFSTPFSQSEGIAPLMLAIGRTLFADE
jgi:hypothetical protein